MAEDKEKIQMLDDGSKAFKLLYTELKDTKEIIVKDMKSDDLLETFTKVDNNIKTYLHYTSDDLRDNKEAKRRAIEKVERVGFRNKVVLPYEGMDNRTVDQRFEKISWEKPHGPIEEDPKPYKIIISEPTGSFTIKDNKVEIDDNIKKIKKRKKPRSFPL